jgi:HEPN domain-containing protein
MMTIEICDEQLNDIVVKELSAQLSYLKEDYEDGRVGVFSLDPDEERKEMKRLIKALERVLDWYGGADVE